MLKNFQRINFLINFSLVLHFPITNSTYKPNILFYYSYNSLMYYVSWKYSHILRDWFHAERAYFLFYHFLSTLLTIFLVSARNKCESALLVITNNAKLIIKQLRLQLTLFLHILIFLFFLSLLLRKFHKIIRIWICFPRRFIPNIRELFFPSFFACFLIPLWIF